MHFLSNKAVICTEFYVRESTWSRWMILVESCFFTKRNETKQVFVQFKDSDRFTLVHLKIEFNNSFRNIRSMHSAHTILAFIFSRCFKNSYAVSHMCFSLSFFFLLLNKINSFYGNFYSFLSEQCLWGFIAIPLLQLVPKHI